MRTVAYQCVANPEAVIRHVRDLAPRTVVVDVEPLIAAWDTGQSSLSRGVAWFLGQISTVPGLVAVCFATNSRRRLSSAITSDNHDVRYVASACKPLRTAFYQNFPRPGLVIGDQLATDGALAWRLKYSFIHYYPTIDVPLGSKLMKYLGYPLRPFLFRPAGGPSARS